MIRDYKQVEDYIKSLKITKTQRFDCYGTIEYEQIGKQQLYVIQKGNPNNNRKIVLSAVFHGEEPAGYKAIKRFLETESDKYLDDFHVIIYPLINPTGYSRDSRYNLFGQDPNRHFGEKTFKKRICKETRYMQNSLLKIIKKQKIELNLSLHEDKQMMQYKNEKKRNFYLHESGDKTIDNCIAEVIIQSVRQIFPINKENYIHGLKNNSGIIRMTDDYLRRYPYEMDSFLIKKKLVQTSIFTETATCYSLEKRIKAHIEAIKTAFAYLKQKNLDINSIAA